MGTSVNVFQQILDDREDRRTEEVDADDRWLRESAGVDPAERLLAWDRWLKRTLVQTLQWPTDTTRREKLVGQCAAEITIVARQLHGRGWLLDGDALARLTRAFLGPIAQAQRAGKVDDFWPYFRASVGRYVGAHAEEIQALSRRCGSDTASLNFSEALAGLGIRPGNPTRGPSMTELLAARADEITKAKEETLRSKLARARARQAACTRQGQLF